MGTQNQKPGVKFHSLLNFNAVFYFVACFHYGSSQTSWDDSFSFPKITYQRSENLGREVPTTVFKASDSPDSFSCSFQLDKSRPQNPPPNIGLIGNMNYNERTFPTEEAWRRNLAERDRLLKMELLKISREDKIHILCEMHSFDKFQNFTKSTNFSQLWSNATIEKLEFRNISNIFLYYSSNNNYVMNKSIIIKKMIFESNRLKNLKSLTIGRFIIEKFEEDALQSLEDLESLIIRKVPNYAYFRYMKSEFPDTDQLLQLPRDFLQHNEKLKEVIIQQMDLANFGDPSSCNTVDLKEDCETSSKNGGFFDVVPPYQHLTKLDLSSNKLTHVTRQMLFNLTQLTSVNLKSNSISSIEPLAFECLLKTLDLTENKLTFLGPTIFSSLRQLTRLDLQRNLISKIDPVAFQNMGQLTDLTLSSNQLAVFPQAVVDLKSLEILDLANNSIQELVSFGELLEQNREELPYLLKLTVLNLQNNKISRISPKFFDIFRESSLEKLELSQNQIDHLDPGTFDSLQQLSVLLLNGNRLQKISPGTISPLNKLTLLNLVNNEISGDLNKLVLPPKLDVLLLENNQLTSVTSLPSGMHQVNLGKNNISFLQPGLFSTMSNKKSPFSLRSTTIDLSDNLLTSIDRETLEPLGLVNINESRPQFKLAGNPWVCDCHLKWLNMDAELNFLMEVKTLRGNDNPVYQVLQSQTRPFEKFVVTDFNKMRCRLSERQKRNEHRYRKTWTDLGFTDELWNNDYQILMVLPSRDFLCEA